MLQSHIGGPLHWCLIVLRPVSESGWKVQMMKEQLNFLHEEMWSSLFEAEGECVKKAEADVCLFVCLFVALLAAHKLFPRHFSQLFLEDSCENMDSDNRGTGAAASWHLQTLMEIQPEEEAEGLSLSPSCACHSEPNRRILVLINGAVCMDSPRKSRAVFPFTDTHVYLPTTDGPLGGPCLVCTVGAHHPSS